MNTLSLCGNWNLAVLPHKERLECRCAKEILDAGLEVIPAKVPGNLELDLRNANKVDDLFFGTNPDRIRRYTEKLHCYYFRSFTVDKIEGRPVLCFEGLDCYADVFINGEKAASFDNMLIQQTCSLEELLRLGENEIFIHIRPAIMEALKYEYSFLMSAGPSAYEQLHVRKPPHMFGWDVMPRYLSAGIWRPAYIVFEPEECILEYYLNTTRLQGNTAIVELQYSTKCDISGDIRLKLYGRCKDSVIHKEIPLVFPLGRKKLTVDNPYLWWPRGFGDPDQYEFELSLVRDGEVLDRIHFLQGLRTVNLEYTDSIDENGNGEFVFRVNNKKIFIKGSNWLPADPFHSRDKARIPEMLRLAQEMNCNMLRCWGGNVYEDDLFYALCDKYGIMVWQDFCFACGKYPQDEEFLRRIRMEAIQVVKRLRSHPCIALWSGDNECDIRWFLNESVNVDPDKNVISRSVLPWVVEQYDPTISYLPSSPYIHGKLTKQIAANHKGFDSAGILCAPEWHCYVWTGYYKEGSIINGRLKFVSEFGSMGAPSPESMKKYISTEKLWPFDETNDEWLMHATTALPELGENNFRIKIFFDQILTLFDQEADSLADFAIKSQITQGEQLKYYLECFRARKWKKTGMLWWNLIDGWPQLSDAVVDYYFDKKMAFYALQSSQQDVCLIVTDADDSGMHCLTAANDTLRDVEISYTVTDMDSGVVLAEGEAISPQNDSVVLGHIPASLSTRFLLIQWYGDTAGKNHYLDIQKDKQKISRQQYLNWLTKSGLYAQWVEKVRQWN